MGKCVSKQTSAISIASTDLVTISITRKYSEELDYTPIHTDYGQDRKSKGDCGLNNEGQSESKKSSKKAGLETKGTAMSFGFRKKLHTPKKKNQQKEKEKEMDAMIECKEKYNSATVISNPGIITNEEFTTSDKNGNSGTESTSEKNEMKRGVSQTVVPPRRDPGGNNLCKNNRFGFRSTNTVRPASTGITPKMADYHENLENNNYTEKRRSKSASGTHSSRSMAPNRAGNNQQLSCDFKSTTPKINPNSGGVGDLFKQHQVQHQHQHQHQHQYQHHQHQQQQQQPQPPQQQFERKTSAEPQTPQTHENVNNRSSNQYTIVNTGMHTNIIVKPTPQPAVSVSKFTLHTTSLPKPQYPVPISLSSIRVGMDSKSAKQVVNTSRKGSFGPREVSADSGISSLDNTFDNNSGSPRRSRNRPRNLEMVMSGRHKFDVKDLEDNISCDSVEPLSLPKLPSAFSSDIQTVPLSGLVRTNTILSRDEVSNSEDVSCARKINRTHSDAESVDEEKLFRDRSTSEKDMMKHPSLKDYTTSSKNSSPGSSRGSWCNAGESLAIKDCSSLSLSSSDDSKDTNNEKTGSIPAEEISSITLSDKPSLLSSLTLNESVPKVIEQDKFEDGRPVGALSNIAESKFAEMAAAVSDILLDDETSPTDSLVSSTESEEAMLKKSKKRTNEDIQEKDIDEISPEIDVSSPLSPGTPTHASNSLSLSEAGRDFLIDDEIADQPGLLFSDKGDGADSAKLHLSQTDTPTLMECGSNKSAVVNNSSKIKNISHVTIEHLLRTPLSLRKASFMNRAESLDTLSPCESIASDDLMMDFESHSSMDSIDRMSQSMRSRCESALQALDDAQIFSDLETKGSEVIREWNNILRVHRTGRDSIISQLPARATRLLNRSRLQQTHLSTTGSDSPKSGDSLPRKSSRASSLHFSNRDTNSSSDDLLLHDKSFRNSMIQDVLYFKKQLIRLRRILQEDEENLMRTETLNPFELSNGQFFAPPVLDNSHQSSSDEKDLGSLTSSNAEDPLQELADLRRQVVYLQGQVDDRDRTIRLQKNLIDKLEAEKQSVSTSASISDKECTNIATQTERVRPLSIGQEGLARSKPECTSFAIYIPATASTTTTTTTTPPSSAATSPTNQSSRRHTIISTTFTNLNQVPLTSTPRRSSIGSGWEKLIYKPVKTTMIGESINIDFNNSNCKSINNNNNNISNSSSSKSNNNNNNNSSSCSINNNNNCKKNQSNNSLSSSSSSSSSSSEKISITISNNKCNGSIIDINNQLHQHNKNSSVKVMKGSPNGKILDSVNCFTNKQQRNNYENIKAEHHSQTVTIV